MRTKNIILIAAAMALILLVPLVLTLLGSGVDGDGWHWTAGDFVFAFVLLFGTGLTFELVANRGGTAAYRIGVGIACATTLILLWVNAAVGIIGDGPVNMLYVGVPAVLIIGAFIARLKARGMVWVLLATAFAQMLVPAAAFLVWHPSFTPGVAEVFGLNAIFAVLWAGSALFFLRAANPA